MDKKMMIAGAVIVVALLGAFFVMSGKSGSMSTTTPQGSVAPVTSPAVSPTSDAALDTVPAGGDAEGDVVTSKVAGNSLTIDSFMFGYSVKELKLKAGESYTVTLTNSEGMHDFVIDELDVRTKVLKADETETITFTVPAEAAGKSYKFYCSVGNHRQMGMEGDVIIE